MHTDGNSYQGRGFRWAVIASLNSSTCQEISAVEMLFGYAAEYGPVIFKMNSQQFNAIVDKNIEVLLKSQMNYLGHFPPFLPDYPHLAGRYLELDFTHKFATYTIKDFEYHTYVNKKRFEQDLEYFCAGQVTLIRREKEDFNYFWSFRVTGEPRISILHAHCDANNQIQSLNGRHAAPTWAKSALPQKDGEIKKQGALAEPAWVEEWTAKIAANAHFVPQESRNPTKKWQAFLDAIGPGSLVPILCYQEGSVKVRGGRRGKANKAKLAQDQISPSVREHIEANIAGNQW